MTRGARRRRVGRRRRRAQAAAGPAGPAVRRRRAGGRTGRRTASPGDRLRAKGWHRRARRTRRIDPTPRPARLARASTCPSGRCTTARWCSTSSSSARSMGVLAYGRLGQSEDPPFTFKVMVVKTNWPGATARDVEQQVTDRIERKLQEVPNIDWVRSYSKPGESLVFFAIKDTRRRRSVPETFYQVRKKVGDIRNTLPAGHPGPVLQRRVRRHLHQHLRDRPATASATATLKDFGDRMRAELLRVPGVAKVDFIGEQDEKIFVELSNSKLATLGIEPAQIIQTLAAQNAIVGRRRLRHADRPHLPAADRRVRLARGDPRHRDPRQQPRVPAGRHRDGRARLRRPAAAADALPGPRGARPRRHDGRGRRRDRARARARRRDRAHRQARCRSGVEIEPVASMPRAVQRSVNEFVRSLAEAVLIVLAVSLLSLGLRTGPRRRGVDPAGARDHVPRACGCSTSACTRSRSAR